MASVRTHTIMPTKRTEAIGNVRASELDFDEVCGFLGVPHGNKAKRAGR
jgi:hypothetical protein